MIIFVAVNIKNMIKRETYIEYLKPFIGNPLVKILTGIRRGGKSTVLSMIRDELLSAGISQEQIISLNFESFSRVELTDGNRLYAFLKEKIVSGKKYYLLFDEIQEVSEWEKVINSALVDFDTDIYLTGSNSHLLSSELATFLTGRYVEIPVYTLSFSEFLEFRKTYLPQNQENNFNSYLRYGGFPVIHTANYTLETAYRIVFDIYSSVILRDTIQRNSIRNIELLERIVKYVFDNIGNSFSGKNIADYFKSQHRKIDTNTVYNYLNALESSFIIYRAPRYDIKGKEILKTQEKFYVSDLSLIYSAMGYRDRMISGILENIIFLEMKRKGYRVFVGKTDNKEIDFVCEKQGEKVYIQVAYKIDSEQTMEREFSPLLSIRDNYPKYVVTMDDFWNDNIEGIKHQHISDFLLMDNRKIFM
jgi:predicted AAA+ superfamily ATPase